MNADHGKVEAIVGADNLAIALGGRSNRQTCRSDSKRINKFTSSYQFFSPSKQHVRGLFICGCICVASCCRTAYCSNRERTLNPQALGCQGKGPEPSGNRFPSGTTRNAFLRCARMIQSAKTGCVNPRALQVVDSKIDPVGQVDRVAVS